LPARVRVGGVVLTLQGAGLVGPWLRLGPRLAGARVGGGGDNLWSVERRTRVWAEIAGREVPDR